ncbi:hypothetical protein PQX77_007873 [Marasmius sp. AFHP31]|nr:hypothetical protein PQX77_007873 [Marasmius sp. AFHP31]
MNTSTPSTAPASSPTDPQEPRNTAMQLVDSPTTSPSPPPPMATAIVDSPPATAASSPPPVATTMAASPQNQNQIQRSAQESVDTPLDPRIASLKAMFPDFDDALLLSVLESAGGNEDRAIDTLLGMSDPDYRSDARPQEPVLSQTELDEQFARQLYMQDEQQYHRQRAQWEAQQPRPQAARQSSQDKDVMTEVSEQFKNIAETGRKTFGNIFSKVKAKISEYDQQRQPQGQSSSQGYYGPGAAQSVNTTQPPGNQQYQAYRHDPLPQSQAQQPAFYDPNPQPSSPTGRETPPPQQSTVPSKEPQGYDASPSSPSAAEIQTPAPPATGSGTGLEKGKLGLLPKRPVSLLAQSPPQSTTNTKPSKQDSDDELEYVENPFEDNAGRK